MSKSNYTGCGPSVPVLTAQRLLPERAMSLIVAREERRVRKHNSKARKKGLPGTLTVGQWLAILDDHGWQCSYCGGPFESIEHQVPLHMGGGTTKENCRPACISCNDLRDWVGRWAHAMAIARQEDKEHVIADLLELT